MNNVCLFQFMNYTGIQDAHTGREIITHSFFTPVDLATFHVMSSRDKYADQKRKRTLIIGDVHGCLDELQRLLDTMDYSPEDRLVFVGDLINKGPDSLGVLEYVDSLDAEVILGNHELGFVQFIKGNYPGNTEMEETKAQLIPNLDRWVQWMENLLVFIETSDFLVIHAGLPPETSSENVDKYVATNIRTWDGIGRDLGNPDNPPWYELVTYDKLIIFGHWANQGLLVRDDVIGLDSGCVYGNQLSGLELPSGRIYQVEAKKTYCNPVNGKE